MTLIDVVQSSASTSLASKSGHRHSVTILKYFSCKQLARFEKLDNKMDGGVNGSGESAESMKEGILLQRSPDLILVMNTPKGICT